VACRIVFVKMLDALSAAIRNGGYTAKNIEAFYCLLLVLVVYKNPPLTAACLPARRKPKRSTFLAVEICLRSCEKPLHMSAQHSPQKNLA
jgi:hypothetical protein